jgi:hypothetical protein
MSMETIVVEKNGKFGPMVDGKYYSFSKFYKGRKEFAEGEKLTVDVYTADSGKKYINSLSGDAATVAPVKKAFVPTVKAAPAKSDVMSKDEWAAKDQRISRQGVIQVAVQVTSSFDDAVILADKMLGYVNGGK